MKIIVWGGGKNKKQMKKRCKLYSNIICWYSERFVILQPNYEEMMPMLR